MSWTVLEQIAKWVKSFACMRRTWIKVSSEVYWQSWLSFTNEINSLHLRSVFAPTFNWIRTWVPQPGTQWCRMYFGCWGLLQLNLGTVTTRFLVTSRRRPNLYSWRMATSSGSLLNRTYWADGANPWFLMSNDFKPRAVCRWLKLGNSFAFDLYRV